MPLVLDYESVAHRATKRRRLLHEPKMTKRNDNEEGSPRYRDEHDGTAHETGREIVEPGTQLAPAPQSEIQTSNREELIECIKRGQRPTWVPKPGLQALYAEEEALLEKRNFQSDPDSPISPTNVHFQFEHDLLFGPWTSSNETSEKPRSALHTGSFDDGESSPTIYRADQAHARSSLASESRYPISGSPPSWLTETPLSTIGQAVSGSRNPQTMTPLRPSRPRAPSLSSSFVMRVPTSPLVNAVNNPNLDFSPKVDANDISESERKSRRRTMPPNSFQTYTSLSFDSTPPNYSRPLPPPTLRREFPFPHQTHQARRSMGSFTFQPTTAASSVKSHGRRLSLAIENSPKRRTSMVGSFEESLVRGRMSSPASKPFDFTAQIGVMGKGDCPANLKCPAHVSVSFQAVFYSYPSSQGPRSIADDTPSPYVGTIDVEHSLKPVYLAAKKKPIPVLDQDADTESLFSKSDPRAPENTAIGKALARDAQLQQQRAEKPISKISLGGAYRVPQQGQLQIIIKNSNKTAVKLFLVPYDLQGMEPGSKTFVRQRSYSSGSILEGALSGTSQQPDLYDPLKDKNILRYLIHVKFCCPSKGKFYLHDNIRVVFANRVPDGKEKLKNEIQLPEPRYSPWKSVKAPQRSTPSSAIEFSPVGESPRYGSSPGMFDGVSATKLLAADCSPENTSSVTESNLPFHIPGLADKQISPPPNTSAHSKTPFVFPDVPLRDESTRRSEHPVSAVQGFFASTSPRSSPVPWGSSSSSTNRSFSPNPIEAGSGLLSQQLKGLNGTSNNGVADNADELWGATASLSRILSRDSDVMHEMGEAQSK